MLENLWVSFAQLPALLILPLEELLRITRRANGEHVRCRLKPCRRKSLWLVAGGDLAEERSRSELFSVARSVSACSPEARPRSMAPLLADA